MDKENLDYLNSIAERISGYYHVRSHVLEYILDNQIKDIELVTNLFITGFLWHASQREEILTTEELVMFLGAEESYISTDDLEPESFILDEEESKLELEDLLELTVKNFTPDI